jgi:hypothetical protein
MASPTMADTGRSRRRAAKRLIGELRADPAHAPETFAIQAVRMLGEQTREDVERMRAHQPDASRAALSTEIVDRGVRRAAVEGGISGTPLYIALVPAYVAMLLEQARMVLRIAALHGESTGDGRAAAELLALRGVHSNPEAARAAVDARLASSGRRARPRGKSWIELGRAMLVLAGFLQAKELSTQRGRVKTVLTFIGGGLLWALTWVVPITFILAMAWGCQGSTETLGERTLRHYGVSTAVRPKRSRAWPVLVLLSAALPATLLFLAAKWQPAGVGVGHVLVGLAALALVLAGYARARER